MLVGQFLGTGAAEGIPSPFCRCPVCEYARREGGREIRLRTCFRLTDRVMVDLGADAVTQAIKYGDMHEVNHVLMTHTHDDHLNPHMLMQRMWAKNPETLHYYFTEDAFQIVEHWRKNPWIIKGKIPYFEEAGIVAFHKLRFGERTVIDGLGVTPFRGNHKGNVGEDSAMYLIELPDGRKLFYGLDSGVYYPETLGALARHRIDIYISEGTMGPPPALAHPTHMGMADVKALADRLVEQGTLDAQSILYLTHISHRSSHKQNTEAVEAIGFPVKTVVTYDGMKIL